MAEHLTRKSENELPKLLYHGYEIVRDYMGYMAYPEDDYYYDGEHDNAVREYSIESIKILIDQRIADDDIKWNNQ